jgi:hypothetical protein
VRALLFVLLAGCSESESQAKPRPKDAGVDAAAKGLASQLVTFTCKSDPCPWGAQNKNHAVVWPSSTGALAKRLGYEVSAAIYLPADQANAAEFTIDKGTATIKAGLPDTVEHRSIGTLKAGESIELRDIAPGELVSVQADAAFTYHFTLHPGAKPKPSPTASPKPSSSPSPTAKPTPRPKPTGEAKVVDAIPGRWRCNKVPGCFSDPWKGAAIAWPEWAANQSNGRSGNVSRSVFSLKGEPLYVYTGTWIEGCEVTAEEGAVQIVEWVWGAQEWRSTVLHKGESHVIHLEPPENSALIEAPDNGETFRVSLRGCTPAKNKPEGVMAETRK